MDQRGIDDQRRGSVERDEGYVGSAEAIALLGVKRETLYAYASRGLVRSVPGPKGRPRLYARADLERLRTRHDARAGHAAVAADALRFGEPVLDSAITEITPMGPRTRGLVLAEAAAEGRTLEAVAELVWASGRGLDAWEERDTAASPALTIASKALARAGRRRLLDHVVLANAAAGALDVDRFVSTADAELARARRVIRLFARSLGLPEGARASEASSRASSIASTALIGLGIRDEPVARSAVNAILVALADHELNASTFAARVAASAGADLYACIGAGLATVSGPKHGGACDRVEALVREAARPRGAAAAVHARLARGEAVPGFGHPLYPGGDPRALPLLEIARRLVRDTRRPAAARQASRTLLAIVDHVAESRGERPSVDVGSVAVALALGAPAGTSTALFALGRTVGWVAHTLEQRSSPVLLRPRARFVGVSPSVSVTQRHGGEVA